MPFFELKNNNCYIEMECLNCRQSFDIHDGLFCMKTTPFFSLENCTLTQDQLLEVARAHDLRHPAHAIKFELAYDTSEKPTREELCTVIGKKIRETGYTLDFVLPEVFPATEKHFFCKTCLDNLIAKRGSGPFQDHIRCCINDMRGVCDSSYDVYDAIPFLTHSTRKLLLPNLPVQTPLKLDLLKRLPGMPPQARQTCRNCLDEYAIDEGVFCVQTNPYYPTVRSTEYDQFLDEFMAEHPECTSREKAIDLLSKRLMTREHEIRLCTLTMDELGELASIPHLKEQISDVSSRDELCEALSRIVQNPRHFICDQNGLGCINALISNKLKTTDQIKCCANYVSASHRVACESVYDSVSLLSHLERPTRILLVDSWAEKASVKEQTNREKFVNLAIPECPHCHTHFVSWEGCYSVKCSSCSFDFCGICLSYFGSSVEVHHHVRADCKKHREWGTDEVNYYGSYPLDTSFLFLSVQTNQTILDLIYDPDYVPNCWLSERRKAYPDDVYLQAPTLVEKMYHFLKELPPDEAREIVYEVRRDTFRDLRNGTNKLIVKKYLDESELDIVPFFADLVPMSIVCALIQLDKNISSLLQADTFPVQFFSFCDFRIFEDLWIESRYVLCLEEGYQNWVHNDLDTMLSIMFQTTKKLDWNDFKFKTRPFSSCYVNLFKQVLVDNNALLAGGFALLSVSTSSVEDKIALNQDLDVYVDLPNAQNVLVSFLDLGWDLKGINSYEDSILKKNHLLSVHLEMFNGTNQLGMDVIITSQPPVNVVSNLDLTFCQVWFDGKNLLSNHWSDISRQSGELNPDYHIEFQKGNPLLWKRIFKYQALGYSVVVPDLIDETLRKEYQSMVNLRDDYTLLNDESSRSENESFDFYRSLLQQMDDKFNTESVRIVESLSRNPPAIENQEEWFVSKMFWYFSSSINKISSSAKEWYAFQIFFYTGFAFPKTIDEFVELVKRHPVGTKIALFGNNLENVWIRDVEDSVNPIYKHFIPILKSQLVSLARLGVRRRLRSLRPFKKGVPQTQKYAVRKSRFNKITRPFLKKSKRTLKKSKRTLKKSKRTLKKDKHSHKKGKHTR